MKAYKRAISWLRLFGEGVLLDRLNQVARQHRATQASAILSKKKIHEKYARSANPSPPFKALVTRLGGEIAQATKSLVGNATDETASLNQMIENFGRACADGPHQEALWQQIVLLADPRQVK